MSLVPFTGNIVRDTVTDDAYGGETSSARTVYSAVAMTFNFYRKDSTHRFESSGGAGQRSPGVRTRIIGVVILDPWDGQVIRVNDRVVPGATLTSLPSAFNVIGVRPYEDELQLDVESVD